MNTINKKILFVSLIILTLLFLFFIYLVLSGIKSSQPPTNGQTTPAPTESLPPNESTNSVVPYKPGGVERVADIIRSKQSLSDAGNAKKTGLIVLADSAGIIQTTQDYTLQYIPSLDIFQIQILTTDISTAKQEAITWFSNQGISDADICNLPVIFYLNGNVAIQLEGTNVVFNPLPDICK